MKLLISLISALSIVCSQTNINSLTQFADYNRMSNAEKMEFEEGGTFHFRGLDPNVAIIPEFDISAKNLIDTVNLDYITLLRSQVYLHQLKPEADDDKIEYDFTILFEVVDSEDDVVYDESIRKNLRLNKHDFENYLYHRHEEEMSTKLAFGDYTLKVTLYDMNSKIESIQEVNFSVRNFYKDKLMISDLRFFDSVDRSEIKSFNNAFKSHEGNVVLYFDTYKKNTDYQFLYDLEITKEKKASEKVVAMVEDLFIDAAYFIQSIFMDSVAEDTNITYYETYLYDDDKKYNRFQVSIPKYEFRNFKFYEPNYGQRYLNVSIRPKIRVLNVVKSNNEDENILNVNRMTDSNFVDMTITSDVDEVLIIDSKEVHSALMTITWDSIPNTKEEFYQVFAQLFLHMEEEDLDRVEEAKYDELKSIYIRTLEKLANNKQRQKVLSYYSLFQKKVQYANQNFFYVFDNGTGNYIVDERLNTGWMSDKGRLYLKYGLPDEITGTNYISNDGEVIHTNLLAKQKWVYNKLNKEFFFIHNKLVN